MTFFLYIMSGV